MRVLLQVLYLVLGNGLFFPRRTHSPKNKAIPSMKKDGQMGASKSKAINANGMRVMSWPWCCWSLKLLREWSTKQRDTPSKVAKLANHSS